MGNLVIRREESCVRSRHELRHKWEKGLEHFYISSQEQTIVPTFPAREGDSEGNILCCNHLGVNSGISDPKDGGYF